MIGRRLAWILLGAIGCGDSSPAGDASTTATDGSTTDLASSSGPPPSTTSGVDDTTGDPPPAVVVLDVDLDLETTASVSVVFTTSGDVVQATVTPSRGYGVAIDGAALTGEARIDALPEAGATFYTAKLSGPAVPDGPCGTEPVSLALSLHHDDDADFVAGGLTAYCGARRFYGIPPIEPLRISGHLP